MRSLDWTTKARNDLAAIDAYWWENAPDRADELLNRIEAAAEFLLGMPHAGPALEEGSARKWSVRSTRYILIYRVGDGAVQILRVHHASEDWPELD
jgi:plasmid stabilization system protein ParE